MSIRRERDARRVAKSVRTHEDTMAAYGRAAGELKVKKENKAPALNIKIDSEYSRSQGKG